MAVDGAQLAVFVGPFVPDAHAMFLQIAHVGIALQEPQQLIDDAFQVQFLGGEHGEPVVEVVAALCAEDADGACSRAVALLGSLAEDAVKYV